MFPPGNSGFLPQSKDTERHFQIVRMYVGLSPAMDWHPAQGVPCFIPQSSPDRLQAMVQKMDQWITDIIDTLPTLTVCTNTSHLIPITWYRAKTLAAMEYFKRGQFGVKSMTLATWSSTLLLH